MVLGLYLYSVTLTLYGPVCFKNVREVTFVEADIKSSLQFVFYLCIPK